MSQEGIEQGGIGHGKQIKEGDGEGWKFHQSAVASPERIVPLKQSSKQKLRR